MAYVEHIIEFEEVMRNLALRLERIQVRAADGLIRVAVLLRNETERVAPVTPVDLGNLRASWFAVITGRGVQPDSEGKSGKFREGTKKSPRPPGFASRMASEYKQSIAEYTQEANKIKPNLTLICGYSAFYAAAVHENLGMHDPSNPYWQNRKWRPGSGAKWFQAAIQRNMAKIVGLIAGTIKSG